MVVKTGGMYRDAANRVDEHDRAVGAVLIAEAVLAACEDAAARMTTLAAPEADRWRAVMEVHDTYPEIWRHLDRARRELAVRGTNTMAFDELRPGAPRSAIADATQVDRPALDAARKAIEQLKLDLPGADWSAIEARTRSMSATNLQRHARPRLVVGIAATLAASAVLFCFSITTNSKRAHAAKAVDMRRELAGVSADRKAQIDQLQKSLSDDKCQPTKAQELTKQLVMDGRGVDAKVFADGYQSRCGDDPIVQTWAAAPQPHHGEDAFVGMVHFRDHDGALMIDTSGHSRIVDVTDVSGDPIQIDVSPK